MLGFSPLALPSYHQGYARSAGESAYQNSWKVLLGAWVPALGVTGGTLRDVSGFGNHGTLTNMDPAIDWVISDNARQSGYALDFDGIDDLINTNATNGSIGLDLSQPFSFVGWIKPRTFGGSGQGAILSADNYFFFHVHSTNNSIRTINNGTGVDQNTESIADVITLGEWHYVAFVHTGGGNARLYVQGRDVTSDGSYTETNNTSKTMLIGIDRTGGGFREFDGLISEIRIYARALSSFEIWEDFQIPLATFRRRRRTIGRALAAVPTDPALLHYNNVPNQLTPFRQMVVAI